MIAGNFGKAVLKSAGKAALKGGKMMANDAINTYKDAKRTVKAVKKVGSKIKRVIKDTPARFDDRYGKYDDPKAVKDRERARMRELGRIPQE
jgi:ribulose kinase